MSGDASLPAGAFGRRLHKGDGCDVPHAWSGVFRGNARRAAESEGVARVHAIAEQGCQGNRE
jgi:hypothetical protein